MVSVFCLSIQHTKNIIKIILIHYHYHHFFLSLLFFLFSPLLLILSIFPIHSPYSSLLPSISSLSIPSSSLPLLPPYLKSSVLTSSSLSISPPSSLHPSNLLLLLLLLVYLHPSLSLSLPLLSDIKTRKKWCLTWIKSTDKQKFLTPWDFNYRGAHGELAQVRPETRPDETRGEVRWGEVRRVLVYTGVGGGDGVKRWWWGCGYGMLLMMMMIVRERE